VRVDVGVRVAVRVEVAVGVIVGVTVEVGIGVPAVASSSLVIVQTRASPDESGPAQSAESVAV
jgi:hypothetical protein